MKKLSSVIILILLFTQITSAQIYKGLGFKVGTTCANVNTNFYGSSYQYKLGFTGGIFKETKIFDKLNLVIGVNYAQKGFKTEFIQMDEYGHYLGTDYINQYNDFFTTEIMVKYDGTNNVLSPFLIAGLRMDVISSHKAKFNGNNISEIMIFGENKVFGAIIGMGLSYKPEGFYTIFLEGSYNPDFTDFVTKESRNMPGYSSWLRNKSFDIRTGIKF